MGGGQQADSLEIVAAREKATVAGLCFELCARWSDYVSESVPGIVLEDECASTGFCGHEFRPGLSVTL